MKHKFVQFQNTPLFLICFIVLLASHNFLFAQQYDIQFLPISWEEAQYQARQTNKPIFVDTYGEKCAPCKKMAENVFTYPDVANYYNQNFINFKIDLSKIENAMFGNTYGVFMLPTLLFFTPEGEMVKLHKGPADIVQMLEMGEEIVALTPKQVNNNAYVYDPPPIPPATTNDSPSYNSPSYNSGNNTYQTINQNNNSQKNSNGYVDYNNPGNYTVVDSKETQKTNANNNTRTGLSRGMTTFPTDTNKSKRTTQNSGGKKKKVLVSGNRGGSSSTKKKTLSASSGKKNNSKLVASAKTNPKNDLKRLSTYEDSYVLGRKNADMMRNYAYLLKKYDRPYNKIVNEHLNGLNNDERLSEQNRQFIYDFADNLNNRAIDFFLSDIQYLKEYHGGAKINAKMEDAIYSGILASIEQRDERLFEKSINLIDAASLPNQDKLRFDMQSLYYFGVEDWGNYSTVAYDYLTVKRVTDPELLNDVAWNFHQFITNKKMLKAALEWVKTSIEIENEYYNNYTYASLLYKLGDEKQAIKAAENAIYIANVRNIDYSKVLRLLDRMKGQRK
ncbi:MAG: thioredoxin family protein [Chitinophagales bacterium]